MNRNFIRLGAALLAAAFSISAAYGGDPLQRRRFNPNRGLNARNHCLHPPVNFCRNCTVRMRMRVQQGTVCEVRYMSFGGIAGQDILVRPQHGIYGTANETATAYRPDPGYTGFDHYEARVYFNTPTGDRTFVEMRVNVLVVPSLWGQKG